MTHTRTHEAGLGYDTRSNRTPHRRVELEKAISLDRAVDGVKDQPWRRPVTAHHHSRNTLYGSQMTLQLAQTYRLHAAHCARQLLRTRRRVPQSGGRRTGRV